MEKKKELGCCGYDELAYKPPTTVRYDPSRRLPTKPMAAPQDLPEVLHARPQIGAAFPVSRERRFFG